MRHLALCALTLLLVGSTALGGVINGSFGDETLPYTMNVPVGSTGITGWTVTRDFIDYVPTSYWTTNDGDGSIDLAGTPGAGGISQSFATVVGASYTVTFDMSGNPDHQDTQPSLKTMRVEVAGVQHDYSFDVATPGHSRAAMKWQTHSFDFTATSNTTTLEFYSTMSAAITTGPALDSVSVSPAGAAVPLPPAALLGLGLLVTLGAARRLRRR